MATASPTIAPSSTACRPPSTSSAALLSIKSIFASAATSFFASASRSAPSPNFSISSTAGIPATTSLRTFLLFPRRSTIFRTPPPSASFLPARKRAPLPASVNCAHPPALSAISSASAPPSASPSPPSSASNSSSDPRCSSLVGTLGACPDSCRGGGPLPLGSCDTGMAVLPRQSSGCPEQKRTVTTYESLDDLYLHVLSRGILCQQRGHSLYPAPQPFAAGE